jgi:proline iminopeptidase
MITFLTHDGRTLSYVRQGQGPLLVMLPGGPGMDPESYFASAHLPGFTQLILCPRGTGASDAPPTPDGYRIAGFAADVEALRVHLGHEQLTLYGHSHGAMIALAYAAAYPGRVARMVMVNGPSRVDEDYLADVALARQRYTARVPDGAARIAEAEVADELIYTSTDDQVRLGALRTVMSRYVARLGPAETAYLDRLCSAPTNFDSVEPMYAELEEGLNLLADAASITAPTLVVAGELDATVPAEHSRKIAAALPRASFAQLDGAGHFVEVEAHEAWVALMEGFLLA